MANAERITFSKPKLVYDILERLGLRIVGNKAGRPKFPLQSKQAKSFYWSTQRIFSTFWDGNIDRDTALYRTLDKLNENGPSIWGTDRSNLVAPQFYPDYPRDLQWNEPADRDLYVTRDRWRNTRC